jgi:toxin HigB-1
MIRGFADKQTECIWRGERVRRLPPETQRIGRRKLRMLNNAENLQDLRVPPGNRLKQLSRDRAGQHSIRINDQWRICCRWDNGDAYEVEIADYH